jgi:PBSX family phage terminase large subunit
MKQPRWERLSVSAQRSAKLEALLTKLREGDRLMFDLRPAYTPHGAAADLHAYNGREIVISGPAGTGKSRGCLEKLHRYALKYPHMRALIVRKTRASLTESGLVTFEQHVLGSHGTGSGIATDILRRNRQSYRYPNGSEIIVGGLDRASRIMSTEFDLIFVQEATELTENDWESLLTRLRHDKMPFQQLIADCNPDHPEHWLKKRAESGRVRMLFSRHEDNPALYDTAQSQWTDLGREYIAVLDALTGVRYHRLRHGKWMQAEGAVYEEFNTGVHVIDRFDIPDDWRRIRVVDFGFVNSFVCA